jgi:Mn2+/Fe2+ NRAMP family transporter
MGLLLILNNKKVMGTYRNNVLQNIIALAGFVVVCLMVYFMYQNLVGYLAAT